MWAAVTFVLAVAVQPDAAAPSGQWEFAERTDRVTGQTYAFAGLAGEGGDLVVRCDERGPNSVYVVFLSPQWLGTDINGRQGRDVVMRFGEEAPTTMRWRHSDDAALINPGRDSAAFVRRLIASESLSLRFTRYDHHRVDGHFSTAGATGAVDAVYQACGASY